MLESQFSSRMAQNLEDISRIAKGAEFTTDDRDEIRKAFGVLPKEKVEEFLEKQQQLAELQSKTDQNAETLRAYWQKQAEDALETL